MLMHRSENVIPEVFRRRFDEHEPIISHSSNLIPLTEMGGQNTPAATWQVKKAKNGLDTGDCAKPRRCLEPKWSRLCARHPRRDTELLIAEVKSREKRNI